MNLLNIEKVVFLKSVSLFQKTRGAVLSRIAELVNERTVLKNEKIIVKGDYGDTLYIVVEGMFKVHDEEDTFAYYEKGGVFGELSALVPEKRIASVTALEDGILLSIDNETLNLMMRENIEVADGIITFLVTRLRQELNEKNKKIQTHVDNN